MRLSFRNTEICDRFDMEDRMADGGEVIFG
jgi:hypothetical protein